jgi:pimeloyl-ACP methyl ester carboxylesterase
MVAAVALLGLATFAAEPTVQFVDVGDGVKLEVLDWGGTGRPIILLAGSGNTAHIYEDFAPQLRDSGHVYGITRRGYGMSSKPERGYSVPELSEDVWRVIQALKLSKPVVVGHSMAGSELSFLGQKHSAQLGALIYLDANADPMDFPWSNAEFRALTMKSTKDAVGPPPRSAADNSSVDAYCAYQRRTGAFPFPPAEIHNSYEINPDGSVGKFRTPPYVPHEIDDGSIRKDYTGIKIPILALIAVPQNPSRHSETQLPKNAQDRADSKRLNEILLEYIHRWEMNLKRADPAARIVELPGAHHYMFLSEEADVLREVRAFLKSLQ